MSDSLHPPPTTCDTCGRSVKYLRVKSNKNGNQGRPVAKCFNTHPFTGQKCDFWRWYSDQQPPLSPFALPGSDDLEPISSPIAGPPSKLAADPGSRMMCAALGCRSTRLRKDCSRQRCKTHCVEFGMGCSSSAHKGTRGIALPSVQPIIPLASVVQKTHHAPTQVLGSSHPSTSSSFSGPVIDPALSHAVFVPAPVPHLLPIAERVASSAAAGPTHASHMTPVFTEQWVTEQRLRAEKRLQDEQLLTQAQRVQQTVYVYVWQENDVDLIVVEFQDGFTWPMFDINNAALTRIGLGSLPSTAHLNLFRPRLNTWTIILAGHVVKLAADDPRIFLKPSTVKVCKDLHAHTSRDLRISAGRIDVTKERSYLRTRIQQGELERALTSLTPTSKRSLSPTLKAMVDPPKKRFCRTAEPVSVSKTAAPHSFAATRISTFKHKRNRSPVIPRVLVFKPDPIIVHDSDSESDSAPDDRSSSPLHRTSLRTSLIKTEPSDVELGPSSSRLAQPVLLKNGKALWPGQLSVAEVINGFIVIEELTQREKWTVPQAFEHQFGVRFPKSTFYEHRHRWNNASQEDRDAALASDVSWASFTEAQRTSCAEVKTTRQRDRGHIQHSLSPALEDDEVEILEEV